MAIKLIGNYAKRLGLPGYSSHQFSVSVETELSNMDEVNAELSRLYHDLQSAVDREIQETGFIPGDEYGLTNGSENSHPNGNATNGNGHTLTNGNGNGNNGHRPDTWNCSDKQKGLIQKLISENKLDQNEVEETSVDRFGVGLRQLNKLQASGLIDELFTQCGKNRSNGNYQRGGAK